MSTAIRAPRGMDSLPRLGRRFWHAHKVVEEVNPSTGKRDPELCKITRITSSDIYYRVGINADGTGGSKWHSEAQKFSSEVLRFAYDTETRYARLLDCGLCFEENGEEVHPHPECIMGRYPEHDKQHQVIKEMDAIRDFVEFAQEKGYVFGRPDVDVTCSGDDMQTVDTVQPVGGESLTRLICEHFGIDRAKILAEKEQMISDMAAQNTPQTR